jgi:hypothetical protein
MPDDYYAGERIYWQGMTWEAFDDYHECPCGCDYAWVERPDFCPWPRPVPIVVDPDSFEGKIMALYQRAFTEQIENANSLAAFLASGKSVKGRRVKVRRS